jgi:hypothetical protein
MKLRVIPIVAVILSLWFGGANDARAVTVNFQGLTGDGQGLLGHSFVARTSIAHMSGFYSSVGVAGPYSAIVSPDAFDTTTGNELPLGTNAPGTPFAATTLPGPHGLEGLGLTGPLHISVSGFTLNVGSVVDLSFSGLIENRIYRNGNAAIFEETAPGVFNQVASWSNAIFDIDIDYNTGNITNTFSGTLDPGSLSFFPTIWTGTSFDPVDVAGTSAQGQFGAFSVTTSFDVDTAIPEPESPLVFVIGLVGMASLRRCRQS